MSSDKLIPQSLVEDISRIIVKAREQAVRSINAAMVQAYWQVGSLIVDQEQRGSTRAEYGSRQLEQLSSELQANFKKGFDISNLRNMRKFYLLYPKQDAVRPELSWTHYRRLIRIENTEARHWYAQETIDNNWSARALDRQVSKLYYERLLSSKDKTLVAEEGDRETKPLSDMENKAYVRDPYILDFLDLPTQSFLESDVEEALITNLQKFLLELGKGFAFVSRQQRINTEDQDFYIDLVFYNIKLKCFLLVDLKLGKLSHQDVGQMDTYVRIYDQQKKGHDDNPTIGLILCSEKSEAVAKYSVLTDSKQLFASKYLPYLPSEEDLRKELERERSELQQLQLFKD